MSTPRVVTGALGTQYRVNGTVLEVKPYMGVWHQPTMVITADILLLADLLHRPYDATA